MRKESRELVAAIQSRATFFAHAVSVETVASHIVSVIMFAFRRAAARAIASPRAFLVSPTRSQSLRTYSIAASGCRQPALSSSISWQRRFASDNSSTPAESRAEPEADDAIEHSSKALESDATVQESGREAGGSTIADAVATGAERASHVVADAGGPQVVQDALHKVAASAQEQARPQQQQNHQIFIGNMSFDFDAEALKSEFSKYGSVLDAKIQYDDRGRSKGFGWITYATRDEAEKAIQEANEQQVAGRTIYVQLSVPKTRQQRRPARASDLQAQPKNPPSRTLWIGNMAYDMTDTDLNNLFRPLKNVVDVRVAIDRRTGQSRGFAHADFMDEASAIEAMESLKHKEVYGRRLRLDYSTNFSDRRQRRDDANAEYNEAPRTEAEERY